ncbi:MAG: penicillin amidase [Pirellulaceae bacterium]
MPTAGNSEYTECNNSMANVSVNNARRPIKVSRDSEGVPHIKADLLLDAIYGLGYMHATDRGTQLLFARSVASGCAAEEIASKDELLETDEFFRRIGLHTRLDEEVRLLDDYLFKRMTAYCEGVNDGLEGAGRSLPMWATGYQPKPWNQQSILLIGKLLSFGGLAISQMQNERLLIELIHAGVNEPALRDLFGDRLDNVDFDVIRQVKMANQLSNDALELITDLPRLAGSNAWAVSPSRSATGGAMLASDPHLEVNRLPAIWYEAALTWGDNQYVMGATLPGCPLFAVARTPRISWGVTYMKGDTVDYFVEDCRRGGETGWQCRRDGEWQDFKVRSETILRKGNEPQELQVHYTDQGTIEGDLEKLGEGYHLSISWSGNSPGYGTAIGCWLDLIEAADADAGMNIVRECPQPTLCWVFADRDGHIGMQSCGRFPIRGGGHIGLAPIPAWDSKNHWQGWVDTKKLPRIYDPPEGYLATANEEQNPPGMPPLITQPLPNYRKRRVMERLGELPAATVDDMRGLQYDIISVQARDLLAISLPHLPASPVKERFENWDYNYAPESTEATLFLRFYRNVMMELLGCDHGVGWRRMLYLCTRAGYSQMLLTTADRLLARENSYWLQGRDKGEIFRIAAKKIESEEDKPWSEVNYFHFTDRFFGNHRVGRMLGFNSRRYPMPGCHATPFQGHVLQTATRETTFAPSYHFVTDMSTDHAWTNIPGGPSESRFSSYYNNDISRWLTGEYKKLAAYIDAE